ncbi:glyceraldehyde-3-phosphate dehydrogenase [Ancylomarina sp. 16SWW S1-10-2]|uniref:glyceraldehyde-3-phosphate dehydrogenase n=1 Tax=Ancylomarina sp. 16SWW S1-10-2 TaxID=2499681 RepID=UPI0034CDE832
MYIFKKKYQMNLQHWIKDEKLAYELASTAGHLWFNNSVDLLLFRKKLVNQSPTKILSFHDYGKNIIGTTVDIENTLEVAKAILKLNIVRSRIDIGKLTKEWCDNRNNYTSITEFLQEQLASFMGEDHNSFDSKDVVLYGFGRIGRIVARELIRQSGRGEQLKLKAIVTRGNSDLEILKRISLLETDSVHGVFDSVIIANLDKKSISINGQEVHMIASNSPSDIDYTKYGIDNALLIDNTGVWRDEAGLSQHLEANGIDKVLLTAPGKGNIPNIVFGVNQNEFDVDTHKIFSAASCTTNAIVPPLYVIENNFEIEKGHLETIHSYTNDQNLLDNFHRKTRRGRSAPINMVLTETGASKAAAKVIPSLKGKLTANAVRIPTPNASLAILMLTLKTKVDVETINKTLEEACLRGDLVDEIEYSYSSELVSSDIIGKSSPAIVDSKATLASADGHNIVLYVWYDNEYGYSRQVMRLAKHIAKVRLAQNY